MLERSTRNEGATAAPRVTLGARRALFFALVGLSIIGLVWLLVVALSVRRFGALDYALVVLFAVTLPWTVISFWNATIGLLIMRFARDPVAAVTPIVTASALNAVPRRRILPIAAPCLCYPAWRRAHQAWRSVRLGPTRRRHARC